MALLASAAGMAMAAEEGGPGGSATERRQPQGCKSTIEYCQFRRGKEERSGLLGRGVCGLDLHCDPRRYPVMYILGLDLGDRWCLAYCFTFHSLSVSFRSNRGKLPSLYWLPLNAPDRGPLTSRAMDLTTRNSSAGASHLLRLTQRTANIVATHTRPSYDLYSAGAGFLVHHGRRKH